MKRTLTAGSGNAAAGMHPRFLNRLEQTLSRRRQDFEAARHKARQSMTEIRDRVSSLETAFGMPLAECRSACNVVLQVIDELEVLTGEGDAGLQPLLEQIAGLTTMINGLNANLAAHVLSRDPPEELLLSRSQGQLP